MSSKGWALSAVPHFSLSPPRLAFLAWGDFHARSRFARSTIPEEKWGLPHSLYGEEIRRLSKLVYIYQK